MAVGGSTAIGRGIFKVRSINEQEFDGKPEELYEKVLTILEPQEAAE